MSSKGRSNSRKRTEPKNSSEEPEEQSSCKRYQNSEHSKGTFPPNIEGMTSLKVDNITQRTGVNLLKKVFSKFGDLGDVYVPRYPDTFASRGFAFVRFIRKRDAEDAMTKMNGYVLDGRVLSIQMARYARPSSSKHVYNSSSYRNSSYRRNSGSRNGSSSRYKSYDRSKTSRRRASLSCRWNSRSPSREKRSERSHKNRSHKHRRSRSRSDTRSSSHSRSRSRSRSRDSSGNQSTRRHKRNKTERDCDIELKKTSQQESNSFIE